jgi:di/tricarboxylate transporter
MEWESTLALGLLVATLVSFVLEKVSVDVTALVLFGIIIAISGLELSEQWPSLDRVLSVFANEAPLTIAAMFIISAALNRCRVIEQASETLSKFCKYGYTKFTFALLSLVAFVSAFINNTPVVVVLLPVVIRLSRTLGVSSSKLLIPVSYASIFGGCCTLVGTSTNILASGIMSESTVYPEMPPMEMFELSTIALPLLAISLGFLVLFGRKLLPDREALSNIISDIDQKEFLTEAVVLEGSPLIGKKIQDSEIESLSGVRLLDVVRKGQASSHSITELALQAGDRLVLSCRPQGIIETRELEGVGLLNESRLGIEQVSSKTGVMVEGVVGPSSSLISKSLSGASFRTRFNITILALHRRGKNLSTQIDGIRLQPSDTLLLLGTEESIERLRKSEEVILLDQPPLPVSNMKRKSPIVLSVLLGIIVIATLGILPISVAAIAGVSILLATGCVKPSEAYQSVEWNILILIYGMLALGATMESTGVSSMIASLVGQLGMGFSPPSWHAITVLIVLYLITAILTEILSNTATIVIMAPIALELAKQMDMGLEHARAYVLTACIAASASFVTPIGYQTNTFVYTVGGYRFRDFMKIGIFFNLIYFIGTILLVSMIWKLAP